MTFFFCHFTYGVLLFYTTEQRKGQGETLERDVSGSTMFVLGSDCGTGCHPSYPGATPSPLTRAGAEQIRASSGPAREPERRLCGFLTVAATILVGKAMCYASSLSIIIIIELSWGSDLPTPDDLSQAGQCRKGHPPMDHIDINASQAVYLGWCLPGDIYPTV